MTKTDYMSIVSTALENLKKLQDQRGTIDVEIAKLEQFITATANLLPEEKRQLVIDTMESIQELYRLRETGLTDAIRAVLRNSAGKWLTVANVRDHLVSARFDFSSYTANPLASISTTLRRMKSEDIETTNVDGSVTAYRWKGEKSVSLSSGSVLLKRTGDTLLIRNNDFKDAAIKAAKAALMNKDKK